MEGSRVLHNDINQNDRLRSPAVSAIIATRLRPKLVQRAIDSVLQQTFADLELIVVVDGPDPETESALSSVQDSRLRVIVNSKNLGSACSRMVGVNAAAGEWVAFLDDDDEWLPTKLERQVEEVSRVAPPDRSRLIVLCLLHIVSPFGDCVRPKRPYENSQPFDVWLFDRTRFSNGSVFQTSSVFVSTELVRSVKFRQSTPHDDWDFVLRAIAERKARIATVTEPLARHYRDDLTPRMSNNPRNDHRIAESLDWLDGLGDAVSRRGYAAFCLSVIALNATDRRNLSWFWPLLSRAFRRGRPTVRQVAAYLALWVIGKPLRRRALAFMIEHQQQGSTQVGSGHLVGL
jgi:glycosyltransferase involved in cell wall biosynthesis